MAKDRRKLQHMHSSIPDKQPTYQSLEVGEIAVNNGVSGSTDLSFLSIKNANAKVVRFSSDGQIIEWMERKEVMPYVGYVRGGAGPSATSAETPTADGYGSYGIENSDLINNTSEIIIKLNQVAASATTKHDKVNGKKDKYNKYVNPTTDGGINDGAGFFIDMSRYAMQDANPQFSGITNTCYTNLNGTTKIKGLDGLCGSLLEIDVATESGKVGTATNEINNAITTIGTAITKINSAFTSANTATTIIKVANASATTATLSGNTLDIKEATRISAVTPSTTISGTSLDINECGRISGKTNEFTIVECATGSGVAKIQETTINLSGTTVNVSGLTTINLSGNTINENSLTSKKTTSSAYTSANTATTVIGTANTSATTATLNGNTLDIKEATRISAVTPTMSVSGTNLNIAETNTTINSCGKIELNTDNFTVNSCSSAGTSTFNFCKGYTLNSDKVTIKECGSNGTILIQEKGINLSGGTLSSTTTADTIVKVGGNLSAYTTGNTSVITSGSTSIITEDGTTIQTTKGDTNINTSGNTNITSTNNMCEVADKTAAFVGTVKTNIGKNCADGGQTTTLNINGDTINETGNTVNISGSSEVNISGGSIDISASTNVNISAGQKICESAATEADFYGPTTKIGISCGNSIATTTTIKGGELGISGNNVDISGATSIDISGGTIHSTSTSETCIVADTTAAFVGTDKTNIGKNCSDGGQTDVLNINGDTINITGGTMSAYTSGKTCVVANTDLNLGGNTNTRIGADCAGNPFSDNVYISATTLTEVKAPTITLSGNTTNVTGTSEVNIKGNDICISGGTEASMGAKSVKVGTDCGGTTIASGITATSTNNINIQSSDICLSGGTEATVGAPSVKVGTNCEGTTIASGITAVSTNNVTITSQTINETATTEVNIYGGNNVNINSKDVCIVGDNEASIGGKEVKVGTNCSGTTIASGITINSTSSVTVNAPTTIITGNTNISGDTIINKSLTVNSGITISGDTNISGNTIINKNLTVSGDTIINKNLTVNSGITVSGDTIIGGDTNISGDTIIGGTLIINNGLERKLSWTYGSVSAATGCAQNGATNFSGTSANDDKCFVIPRCVQDMNRAKLTWEYGDVHNASGKTYDPGAKCDNNPIDDKIIIPKSLSALTNWNNNCLEVGGCVKATSVYSTSDERLKENIERANFGKAYDAHDVEIKQFNFVNDESKRITYGVIAQDVLNRGLDELVYTDGAGIHSVDYTSLMMLKIKFLENELEALKHKISQLENKEQ